MLKQFLKFNNVSYMYETSIENILNDVSFHLSNGWTGVVGVNGAGKSTLLKLASGIFNPSKGNIIYPGIVEYCEQRTDVMPYHFVEMLNDYGKRTFRIIDMLNLKDDWQYRWNTLSHGERKRVQIGTALWKDPELLAIDEPTNHLDASARRKIIDSLKTYRGIGLIVSHDRELLDDLCTRIMFVENANCILRTGGITSATEQHKLEKQLARDEYNKSKDEVQRLEREITSRSRKAEKSRSQSSKKKIHRKDHDAKEKIDRGRITGKDAVGGKLKSQLNGRLNQAISDFENKSLPEELYLGISLTAKQSKRNYLYHTPGKSIKLNEQKNLTLPELWILPTDKIGLTGNNGTGKSTLLNRISDELILGKNKLIYIPQEIDKNISSEIIREIKQLPKAKLGQLLIIVSRLGADAKRILETELPSPGELRKLMLATGMLNEPELIIMDEPTNHLDLPSIECIETALSEINCALLLVSHDKRFLEKSCNVYWNIEEINAGKCILKAL